ncbi:MAG: methylmalonyl-CoA mutase, partial [Hyphomicrobiales bacterium]|nr:methylmalonyl-CoA mutase [Hyphomicrobiales bacterium]
FTISTALQYAQDCIDRGMDIDHVLRRFTFFFDISISFFEEVAKFRAGRRIWARLARERLGAKDPGSWRFKFHGQTSGVDLTVQQPLNNIARVAVQAMAGIMSGLQSLHTDAYDEAITTPTEETARIAVATQNILREEAHLCDVIDPLGGSYYVETLTDQMEEEMMALIGKVDEAGGMYKAAEAGLIQAMVGQSALAFQEKVESGEEKVIGVNCYQADNVAYAARPTERPELERMQQHVASFAAYKAARSQTDVNRALDTLKRAANSEGENIYGRIVEAAEVGITHGEIVSLLREELGFGHPLVVV